MILFILEKVLDHFFSLQNKGYKCLFQDKCPLAQKKSYNILHEDNKILDLKIGICFDLLQLNDSETPLINTIQNMFTKNI